MNPSNVFDVEALLRSVLIGLGAGLIVSVISSTVLGIKRGKLLILGLGVTLVIASFLFFAWPSLVEVPALANLGNAEAEDLLKDSGLVPEGRQQVSETERDRIVPFSQKPSPGLKVRKGTVVQYAVSAGYQAVDTTKTPTNVNITLFRPSSGSTIRCTRFPDNIYRIAVEGTSSGLSQNSKLLLWIRPVNPPSETPGWYLQRLPINGVTKIEPNGSWRGVIQLGNAQWPPHEGNTFDIAVSVTGIEAANSLFNDMGVITRNDPIGMKSDIASGVIVSMH